MVAFYCDAYHCFQFRLKLIKVLLLQTCLGRHFLLTDAAMLFGIGRIISICFIVVRVLCLFELLICK